MRIALLAVLLAACESAEPRTEEQPSGDSTERTSERDPDDDVAPKTASRHATRLADYKAKEHLVAADAIAAGEPVRIYDFDVKLGRPELAEPELRLPWIANVEERAAFRGKRALIVPMSARNDAPVARGLDLGLVLHTRDGKRHTGGVYNERLAAKQRGVKGWYDLGRLAPDTWVDSVVVFDVDPAHVEGVLYLARWITVRDRWGRGRSVVQQHVVVDLHAAIDAPPIRAVDKK
jgi:hypothetical protein